MKDKFDEVNYEKYTADMFVGDDYMKETIDYNEYLSENGLKKFTKTWDIENFSVLTDNGFQKIDKLHETIPYDVYHLILDNGFELKCADNHIVMLPRMVNLVKQLNNAVESPEPIECYVKNLKPGDLVLTNDDIGCASVVSVTNLGYQEEMYDLQLSDDSNHRYYTNGILSHNTAIVEGLALKIANNDCPRTLQGKRLVTLDLTAMVAGTKYRGQFEERIKALMDEVRNNDDIILFIDEIHTMIGAGGASGSLDASNIFKPALARGELQCIGATTLDEYREHIEKDGALDRRFQKVMVDPPTVGETVDILMNIKHKYEDFHKVEYTDEAIEEIVRLADRYITNREFPDKAMDIMDEAGSRTQITIKPPQKLKDLQEKINQIKLEKGDVVKLQNFEKAADLRDKEKKYGAELEKAMSDWKQSLEIDRTLIDENMIADVVSSMTGIPVSKVSQNEIKKLLEIDSELKNSIIGQDTAVQKVSSAIRRNRTGIRKKNKPIGSFLFIGSTGVGKTELAKRLAEKVFGSEEALIRFDMSEYAEKFTVSKLIGAPPGYVGYEEGGQLTEKVKNKPYCVVLLDEIEKAHPDIFNILLQVLDEGHLTDGNGRKINFKNTLIIMTSNVGVKQAQDFAVKIGFSTKENDNNVNAEDTINKELKRMFKPEFLNRVNETVFFNSLSEEDIVEIIDLQLNELSQRLLETNYTFKVTDSVKKYILKNGYDRSFGAREIQRTIQKYVEDPISEELLKEHMPKFADIFVDYDEAADKLKIELTQ